MSWWNPSYKFRRILKVTSSLEDVKVGHYVTTSVSASKLNGMGKVRDDYGDIEVVHMSSDATPVFTVLGRIVTADNISFHLSADLDNGVSETGVYHIYYGNRHLVNTPTRPTFDTNIWSVVKAHTDNRFSYTRPGEHWKDGNSSTKEAVATLRIYGPYVRIKSQVSDSNGIAEISIDDSAWEDIDLYSVTTQEEYVFSKTNLSNDKHRVQIRVSGRKNPSSSGNNVSLVQIEYQTPVAIIDVGEEIYNFDWASLMSGA